MHAQKLRLWNGMNSSGKSVGGEWSRLLLVLVVFGLLVSVALTSTVSAPSNWYNPERESHDVNHGVDTVQSLAITNSEDYYSNTSGHCAIFRSSHSVITTEGRNFLRGRVRPRKIAEINRDGGRRHRNFGQIGGKFDGGEEK